MRPLTEEFDPAIRAEAVAVAASIDDHVVLLSSGGTADGNDRFSFVAAFPILRFTSRGVRGEWSVPGGIAPTIQFGNPWQMLLARMARYELLDELDAPYPTGGCFGYWGYDLGHFLEPRVRRTTHNDLELPDCRVGFYPSLAVWDHHLHRAWVVATGLTLDGDRTAEAAREQLEHWRELLCVTSHGVEPPLPARSRPTVADAISLDDDAFLRAVDTALRYIGGGDVYQVNLSRRWTFKVQVDPCELFDRLAVVSPAPYAGLQRWPGGALVSSSPEQFLRISGDCVVTRPIKGTRPRSGRPDEDARLSYELQASEKERAELVMITDLLRNDLGRVCEFGSVHVPELLRLERYSHVQHLVSTVAGRLRRGTTHLDAMAACFPGGSITGAPKIRAMQIIDEIEPVSRGPYTGSLGYAGFNRESQWNILIRSTIVHEGSVHYHAGSGIVADSQPAAELEETRVKARAFFEALQSCAQRVEDAETGGPRSTLPA